MTALTKEGERLLPDIVAFGRQLLRSKDIDPLYPILAFLEEGMDEEDALWFTTVYVAWYHLPSAVTAHGTLLSLAKGHLSLEQAKQLPTGVERRNNRGGRVIDHLKDFRRNAREYGSKNGGSIRSFLTDSDSLASGKRTLALHDNWHIVNEQLQRVHGNGRWAAYKHCEILRRVHDWPILAPDMGNQFSSGPREGLATLFGDLEGQGPEVIAELDKRGVDLQCMFAERGLDVDIEELETILCNWKSLRKGKYYVGHDIDELQEQIEQARDAGKLSMSDFMRLIEARLHCLPNHYLGELSERHGIDKRRMTAYRDRGKVLIRKKAQ